MKSILKMFLAMTLIANIATANNGNPPSAAMEKTLAQFSEQLVGRYTNTKQHNLFPDLYYHVNLSICPIWENEADVEGKWFYLEHCMHSMIESPIRQFVWHVNAIDENNITITIYEIPKKKEVVNTCKAGNNIPAFEKLTIRDLKQYEGCEIKLHHDPDGTFDGRMGGYDCETHEGAAQYLRSELKISKKEILIKDQGFNADGEQVWGPKEVQTPYSYKKVSW